MKRFAAPAAAFALAAATSFEPERFLAHIRFLASPELKGRATGSPELEKAAAYIADRFRAVGLGPPPRAPGYLQPFDVTSRVTLGKVTRLEFSTGGDSEDLQAGKDFIPLSFSASGRASAGVVFVGYGITAPEYDYDDYAGLDVKGRFVVALMHEPQEYDGHSVFEGKSYTWHSQPHAKAAEARLHGARGLILVNDVAVHPEAGDNLIPFGGFEGPAESGIFAMQAREEVVQRWFDTAGKDLEETQRQIDSDLKPRSFALGQVQVRVAVDLRRETKKTANVAAYLPGRTDEYIAIGAHYDHIGLGEQYSMAPWLAGTIHPGADDNASGTAGVLELARYFASLESSGEGAKPRRGFLFLTFAGEELGLLGSQYYTEHPELPLGKAVTMINLDMIGRLRDGHLIICGAGTGTTLRGDLDRIAPRYPGLKIDYSDVGYGSSDHSSFTAKQVPALFFFSGLHGDYHKPGDTWDKIDAARSVELLRFIADVAGRLDSDEIRPEYTHGRREPESP